MAAILNVDPWRSAIDVYLEKTGSLSERTPSDTMIIGSNLESGLLVTASSGVDGVPGLGALTVHNTERRVPGTNILDHHDARIKATGEPVEAKVVGIKGQYASMDQWGKQGTGEVPEGVVVQCHVHMLALPGTEVCHVPTLQFGRGLVIYKVQRSQALSDLIVEESQSFWQDNVLKQIPPDGTPSLETLKNLKRKPNKLAKIKKECYDDILTHRCELNRAQKKYDEIKAEVINQLGDAEAGVVDGSDDPIVTYYARSDGVRVLRVKDKTEVGPDIRDIFQQKELKNVASN